MLRSRRSLAARQREMRKRQSPRRGRGRPRLPIDPETVTHLAAQGYYMLDVAAILGCSPNTIYKRLRPDFDRGRALFTARLRYAVFTLAMDGHGWALRWLIRSFGLYGEKLPKRVRPSAASKATYGAPRRGCARRRVLSQLAPKKAPSGAKNRRPPPQSKAVMPAFSATPPAPNPARGGVKIYEILW